MSRSYDAVARGLGRTRSIDTLSPVTQLNEEFTLQSYFDTTLLENALLTQPQGSLIVPSTLKESQLNGYAIGLHPSSQTPVAINFRTGAGSSSAPVVLRPGQIVTPMGEPDDSGRQTNFDGFQWGLPYGWLGGGVATLMVFHTPTAAGKWDGASPEIIFHRVRVPIITVAAVVTGLEARKNWPGRFPWVNAKLGANQILQDGKPVLTITPTKTLMVLTAAANASVTLAADTPMRVLMQRTNEGVTSAGASQAIDVIAQDFTWPAWTPQGTTGILLSSQRQARFAPEGHILNRVFADDGGVALVDISFGALASAYVDFVRYGTL